MLKRSLCLLLSVSLGIFVAVSCQKPAPSEDIPQEEPTDNPGDEPEVPADPAFGIPLPEEKDATIQQYMAPEAPFEYDETYTYDPTDFPNPERGPYSARSYSYRNGDIPKVATAADMAATRAQGTSLIFTFFYLCDFLEAPINDAVLAHMRQHFINLRESGCKTVLRCAYCWEGGPNSPNVQEPELDVILGHIEQIKPIVQEFSDVIYVWQAGFVGTYGEWAYTTNIKTDEQRGAVVKAMLDALPKTRMVAVRTPAHKRRVMRIIEGVETYYTRDSITVQTGFDGSYKSRVSFFNDCAFVNGNDGGTYADKNDRLLVATESNYVMNGGESCYQGDNTYCECKPAYSNLRQFHWQYLSNHHDIVNVWKEMGCFEDASARVGYRFVLAGAAFDSDFRAGSDMTIDLCLTNYGWGSLINPHQLEFIVANDSNPSEKYVYVSEKDPREWKGCHWYTHSERFILPESLKPGAKYNLYINIADSEPTIHDRADYSIRFANKNIWDPATGYNLLTSFTAK